MRQYTYRGCIWIDYATKRGTGRCGCRYIRGVGRQTFRRYVAEVEYHGKRYRCRNVSYNVVRRWLDDMCAKFNDFEAAARAAEESESAERRQRIREMKAAREANKPNNNDTTA